MPLILGGGIAGLSAAYYLVKNNVKGLKVLEATQRIGGWIQSNVQDDLVFEQGIRV